MNEATPSPTPRRPYDNSFRLEQAQETRRRILEAAVEEISTAGAGASLAQVARRAGVSEPTLYRHFGSRERLFEELDGYAQEKLGLPAFPSHVADLPEHVAELFSRFDSNAPLVQAAVTTAVGSEMRARGRARRTRQIEALLRSGAPGLDDGAYRRVTGVLRVLASWEAFQTLTEDLALPADEASSAVAWAMETLLAALDQPGAGGRAERAPRPSDTDPPATEGSGT